MVLYQFVYLFLDSFSPIPANTLSCDNVAVSLRRRKPNVQRCSNVDVTTSKLQRCSSVTSTLDSTFNLWCTMNVVHF